MSSAGDFRSPSPRRIDDVRKVTWDGQGLSDQPSAVSPRKKGGRPSSDRPPSLHVDSLEPSAVRPTLSSQIHQFLQQVVRRRDDS